MTYVLELTYDKTVARRSGRSSDPVRVAAAGIGGCAERCAMDGRDTEDNVRAEIVDILGRLPKEQRQPALDVAAARYVDGTAYRHAECAALLERAGANLVRAREIRTERAGHHGFTIRE